MRLKAACLFLILVGSMFAMVASAQQGHPMTGHGRVNGAPIKRIVTRSQLS
jgi:hypothetical protein